MWALLSPCSLIIRTIPTPWGVVGSRTASKIPNRKISMWGLLQKLLLLKSAFWDLSMNYRQQDWASLRQTVKVESGKRYITRCFFKLLNMKGGVSYIPVSLIVGYHYSGIYHSRWPLDKSSLQMRSKEDLRRTDNNLRHIYIYIAISMRDDVNEDDSSIFNLSIKFIPKASILKMTSSRCLTFWYTTFSLFLRERFSSK